MALQQLKHLDVIQLDEVLRGEYSVSKSFDAGSVTDCIRQDSTQFGDVTNIYVCNLISAKVYYPRIKITKQQVSDKKSVITEKESISYVDENGGSLRDFIQLGIPISQLSAANPYRVESNLGLGGFGHVNFSGVDGLQVDSSDGTIGDKWKWSSNYSWLGTDSPGSELADSINKKILADQSPAKGAPTPSEALANNTAPLVAYFTLRYCHSSSGPLLDNLCVLPD